MEINIGIIAIIVLAIAILAILASGYVKASPNKAYIISGIKREPKVLIGRAGIKIPFLEKKDELILKQISIDIKTNGYIPTKGLSLYPRFFVAAGMERKNKLVYPGKS